MWFIASLFTKRRWNERWVWRRCEVDMGLVWGQCKFDIVQVEEKEKQYKSGGGGGGKVSEKLRSKKGRKKVKKCFSPLPSLTCTICAIRISELELEMKAADDSVILCDGWVTAYSFHKIIHTLIFGSGKPRQSFCFYWNIVRRKYSY